MWVCIFHRVFYVYYMIFNKDIIHEMGVKIADKLIYINIPTNSYVVFRNIIRDPTKQSLSRSFLNI